MSMGSPFIGVMGRVPKVVQVNLKHKSENESMIRGK